MFSFSWAMSLFGMQQMANLVMGQEPNRSQDKVTRAFDSVTRATEEQLGDTLLESFKAGDKFQREMTNLMFGMFMPRQGGGQGMMGAAKDAMGQASNCCGSSGWAAAGDGLQDGKGWGPMPAVDAPGGANDEGPAMEVSPA
jgi:hypothetical protein